MFFNYLNFVSTFLKDKYGQIKQEYLYQIIKF